jgi:hypothetical protein
MDFGTLAEYLLTHPTEDMKQIVETGIVPKKGDNYYRYCLVNNDLFLRSQIDCRDMD